MTQKLDLKLIRERAEALCDLDNITVAEYAKRYNSYIEVAGVEAVLALLSRLEQAEQQVARVRELVEDFNSNGNSRELGDPIAGTWHDAARQVLRALGGEQDG